MTQMRIPLRLKFSGANLISAEQKAKELSSDIEAAAYCQRVFPLAKWGLASEPEAGQSVGFWVDQLIKRAEDDGLAPSSIRAYRRALGRLPRAEALTGELLLSALAGVTDRPRTQLLCYQKFGQLAKLAGLHVDLSRYRGSYSPALLAERPIPTREQIVSAWRSIQHPGWRWVLGVLIVFGVRNHEALQLDLDDLMAGGHSVFVRRGKTGPHTAWALSPEDIDIFELRVCPCSPRVSFASNDQAGSRVGKYLSRRRLGGWTPYDLRHAWAIETAMGPKALPLALAAQSQGHSQRIHESTYQRWTSPEVQRGAYESAHGVRS
jgi:integrase